MNAAGMTGAPGAERFAPGWLELRESADAAARATDLLGPLRAHLPASPGRLVVWDLGCGTGSLGRWLAGRLDVPQHWILHDRDPDLLERARDAIPGVTTETRAGDITRLGAADLAGAGLVAASALLDLLTFDEVDALAEAITGAGCPALLTLSVAGRVELDPYDPADAEFAAAFNAHQRRETGGRSLLGPDAVTAATEAFERRGAAVRTSPSPWRLGPGDAALAAEWLRGWVAAACEERPDLPGEEYLRRRLDDCAAGRLSVVVHHRDLLAVPSCRPPGPRPKARGTR
ncbi:class I SAM-dependent methyltransferase [Actinomadura sp. SCN-SB]|uniref:class I SAM-dependent methyltransferase n=1 Tax=Actinomadura sp. SCN-SB TaxID=3373092 RepID=UPI0037519468